MKLQDLFPYVSQMDISIPLDGEPLGESWMQFLDTSCTLLLQTLPLRQFYECTLEQDQVKDPLYRTVKAQPLTTGQGNIFVVGGIELSFKRVFSVSFAQIAFSDHHLGGPIDNHSFGFQLRLGAQPEENLEQMHKHDLQLEVRCMIAVVRFLLHPDMLDQLHITDEELRAQLDAQYEIVDDWCARPDMRPY